MSGCNLTVTGRGQCSEHIVHSKSLPLAVKNFAYAPTTFGHRQKLPLQQCKQENRQIQPNDPKFSIGQECGPLWTYVSFQIDNMDLTCFKWGKPILFPWGLSLLALLRRMLHPNSVPTCSTSKRSRSLFSSLPSTWDWGWRWIKILHYALLL